MNYPGGKGGVYQRLINLMPPHEVYIETHLGGGAIIRYKKPAKRNIGIEIDPKTIEMWTKTSRKIDFELIHGDAIRFLESHNFTEKELVYCDPPYLRKVRKKRYPIFRYEYTIEQHEKLLEVIKSLPCMVMISGYKSSLYEKSLKGWYVHSFQAASHHGIATEWIWMNYPLPVALHDYRYLGDNFRERERITKRTKNWVARLKKMPALERKALLSAISSLNDMDNSTSKKHTE